MFYSNPKINNAQHTTRAHNAHCYSSQYTHISQVSKSAISNQSGEFQNEASTKLNQRIAKSLKSCQTKLNTPICKFKTSTNKLKIGIFICSPGLHRGALIPCTSLDLCPRPFPLLPFLYVAYQTHIVGKSSAVVQSYVIRHSRYMMYAPELSSQMIPCINTESLKRRLQQYYE